MNTIPVSRKNRGFTLIELLVVIAIIAILAAILFPVFARARENARRASCQSNEKNIALGFKQYIQDNGEKYPPEMLTGTELRTSAATGGLSEYIKSTAILFCPSDSDKSSRSYGYNNTIAAMNESAIDNLAGGTAGTALLRETSGTRHFDGMNVAYVDGHVKWKKGEPAAVAFLSTTPTGSLPAGVTVAGISFNTDTTSPGFNASQLNSCSPATPCPVPKDLYKAYYQASSTTTYPATVTMTTASTPVSNSANTDQAKFTNSDLPFGGYLDSTQKLGANKDFQMSFTVNSETKTFYFRTGA